MKKISIVTPCYNEKGNVELISERVKRVFEGLDGYDFEHIFADNCSEDGTLEVLRELAARESRVKVIANSRNFGPTKSVFHAVLNASGDAVVVLAADLQDPPELIVEFIRKWEEGYQVVFGIRRERDEGAVMVLLRKAYYRILRSISDEEMFNDAGDFVLFDRKVLRILQQMEDSNPYIRGLLASIGYKQTGVEYRMQKRHSGKTTTNFPRLAIYALNGLVHQSMYPLRMATIVGLGLSGVCLIYAIFQLCLKLVFWDEPPAGIPTLTVGLFLISGVQLFLIGLIGEFVGAIFRQQKRFPLIVEEERINFENDSSGSRTRGEDRTEPSIDETRR